MGVQSWQEILQIQEQTGTSFGTFTTAKTVINPQALYVFPAGYFVPRKRIRITVAGSISNIVTTPGLIVFQVMLGSNIVFTTGNIQLNATAHTNLPFSLVIDLTCRATGNGTNANFMGQGMITGVMVTKTAGQTDGANSETIINVPVTAPAVGAGFDSTIANILDFFAGFTISNAGNTVKIEQYMVEALN